MKKTAILTVCIMITVISGGCTEPAQTGEIALQTEISLPEAATSVETVTMRETLEESSEYEDCCTRLLDYMNYGNEAHTLIGMGCFYDFDRDGFPELAELTCGDDSDYTIYIHSIKDGEFYLMGEITVDCREEADIGFSLYKDSGGEYFYIGEDSTTYWGTDMCDEYRINKFTVKDGGIHWEQIGAYSLKYDPDNRDSYNIEDNYFLSGSIEPGYYKKDEFFELSGISGYLSGFEKVEEVFIAPQWNYIDWSENEKIIREIVREWF